jgi:hypothetical protein
MCLWAKCLSDKYLSVKCLLAKKTDGYMHLGQMSDRQINVKCLSFKCLLAKMSSGNMPVDQMPVGKMHSGQCKLFDFVVKLNTQV